ncbi:FKBP-type peptidyl-prolyl cis-trans isomerase N-terminal domain-containing protein [Erwinia amylovora]
MKVFKLKPLFVCSIVVFSEMTMRTAVADNTESVAALDAILAADSDHRWSVGLGSNVPPVGLLPVTKPYREDGVPAHRTRHSKRADVKAPRSHQVKNPQVKADSWQTSSDTQLQTALDKSRKQIALLESKLAGQATLCRDAAEESQRNSDRMQRALLESQDKLAELRKKLVDVDQEANVRITEINTLRNQFTDSNKHLAEMTGKWQQAQQELAVKKKKNDDLPAARGPVPSPSFMPKTTDEIRDYALGAYWAQEMEGMIEKKQQRGYSISRQVVLRGASDMMNNQLTIKKEDLAGVLQKLYQSSKYQSDSSHSGSENEGRAFLASFSKEPGVKRSEMGYYYKTIEKGSGKIKGTDTVAVVMRESLWNGKVINDMNEKGTVLVLPLAKYPPLFRSVITMMHNHGIEQFAVPPELAYGSQGRPPLIPQNSVMLYELKVVAVTPAS